MHSPDYGIRFVAVPSPPSDPESRAVVAEFYSLSPSKQKAWLRDGLRRKAPELDLLLDATSVRNPDQADASRGIAHHLVETGNWGVLYGLIRTFASAEELPAEPTAAILSDLYGLRQLWSDPFRYRLMTQVIEHIESQWDRPPGYEGMVFE